MISIQPKIDQSSEGVVHRRFRLNNGFCKLAIIQMHLGTF